MAEVILKNIRKMYDAHTAAVDDFNIHIKDKEFIVLVGPSGCGKSTTLRMIAGLEEITEGQFLIDEIKMNDVPPKDRDIAMVFQNYALYPHMNVYDNIAFGLKMKKVPKQEIRKLVMEAAKILELEPYLKRKPKALSGGQRQRVALGRAIVRNAKLFLMDEPLSNLDAKLRVQMRSEIVKLHHRFQKTTIYVTHDQTEAMTMADRLVVMKDGVIQQIGPPKEVYDNPENLFVSSFIGSPPMNILRGKLEGGSVHFGSTSLTVPQGMLECLQSQGYEGSEIVVGIRPEHVYESGTSPAHALVQVKAGHAELLGAEKILYNEIDGQSFVARVHPEYEHVPGSDIQLGIDVEKIQFFDVETEKRIRLYEHAIHQI